MGQVLAIAMLLGSQPGSRIETPHKPRPTDRPALESQRSSEIVATTSSDAKNEQAELLAAIAAYESLASDARQRFTRLTSSHSDQIAAKAYLYLGILTFDELQMARARREFLQALVLNPAIDLPHNASPKAQLAFNLLRQQMTRGAADTSFARAPGEAAAGPVQRPLLPANTTEAQTGLVSKSDPPVAAANLQVAQAVSPPKSHLPSWLLFAAAGVAAGVATYGLVQILNYNALADHANRTGGVGTGQFDPAESSARTWQPLGIGLAIASAGAAGGAILVW